MNYPKLIAPDNIRKEAEMAMSFYPELAHTEVEFKYNDMVRKNFMQAQPKWTSLLKSRKERAYIVLISKKFKVEDKYFTIDEVPNDVLIGWLGHELGHVMDYRSRSTISMLIFGLKYLYSPSHIKEVERTADDYAVKHGMGNYILKTKDFILNNTSLSDSYKDHMRKFYLSPEEITELINRYGTTGKKPTMKEMS
ncbi:hypothetical protein [Nonlabens antarcticus]|uniref:hypothetical protein n=1 Tax=Nonlabens antarcticus TaxID=392714 RepID=UPI0018912201|nr:hypothetical protein [Nonlabens antarcticus]